MARTVGRRKGAGRKAAGRKARAKSTRKVKTVVRKKAAAPKKKAAKKAAPRVKASAKKAAPKKAASQVARKKVVARVPAARRPAVRRTRVAAPPRRKVAAPRLKAAVGTQRFAVSHLNQADFRQDGLRSYALYRDLGIAAASGGLCQAHVIRLLSPCTDEVRKRHAHEPELQLIYVLKGWIKNEFDGQGVQMMSAGSCWLQPPGIKHTVLDYSPDVELLEIIVPADFKTVEVD
jgi:hypothetical protein